MHFYSKKILRDFSRRQIFRKKWRVTLNYNEVKFTGGDICWWKANALLKSTNYKLFQANSDPNNFSTLIWHRNWHANDLMIFFSSVNFNFPTLREWSERIFFQRLEKWCQLFSWSIKETNLSFQMCYWLLSSLQYRWHHTSFSQVFFSSFRSGKTSKKAIDMQPYVTLILSFSYLHWSASECEIHKFAFIKVCDENQAKNSCKLLLL